MKTITVRNKELYKINLIIGISAFVISLLMSLGTSIYFLFGFLITLVSLGISNGVEFDPLKNSYRKYRDFFGFKSGGWKVIPTEASLVILSKYGTQITSGGKGVQEISRSSLYYELYLMNKNHHGRFFIDNSEEKLEIETLARKISERTNLEIRVYNPL